MKKMTALFLITAFILTLSSCNNNQIKSVILADVDLQFRDGERAGFLFQNFIVEEIEYYALGEHAEYYFVTGNEWTNEYMRQLIAVSEDGVKFVKNWLGDFESNQRLAFIFGNMNYDPPTNSDSHIQKYYGAGGGVPGGREVFMNNPIELMPSLITHEAVHANLRKQERFSNFPEPPGGGPIKVYSLSRHFF